jgi:carboxyl-terminal processing protease
VHPLPVPETQPKKPAKKHLRKVGKGVLIGGGAALLIFVGWAWGQGRISFHGLGNKSASQTAHSLDYSSLDQVYQILQKNYDGKLDNNAVLDGLKAGLARSTGDPYTEYFNAEQAKSFDEGLSGSFTGIGAELGKDKENIVIIAPISGFPAEKAGLKPKDILVAIDGQNINDISITDAVKRIRGPKDTKVKLKVARDGKPLEFEITRDNINIPSVKTEILPGNIGYMHISRFSEDTTQLAEQGAQQFKQANVKGVILDVRGDPGGLLNTAVDVASLWLPQGKTVLSERRDGVVVRNYQATGNDTLNGIPTIVLMDDGSASASEIVAGALKDNGAATLIGVKTYGKGSVQQIERLPEGAMIKVTIARWYTPSGHNIDKQGIEPDKNIKISDEDAKAQRDTQKDAAIQALGQR